ncbi:virulence factor Mce family protein [Saccharomonospora marina XMU15]|uniref:Virulence factor Mce family protein n=1 Tax=Saccharomonospora marina XMU15 TaxID=882083 RepID=H5X8F8_9PSEU|nr:MCE family protein [Saccharomonospora marina]EHR50254.1 virulence factor Mce family protein [Saccharomonospora marina XMU15]
MSEFGSARRHLEPIVGVVFVALLLLAAWGAWSGFNRELPWQRSVEVTLTTPSAGLGLISQSDVKIQGVLVGTVREVVSDGRQAVVRLSLDPEHVGLIPANVDAAIVPKTLFGEKYVDLRPPPKPTARRIASGDEIRQSRESVELGELFTNLNATLRALRPEQLSLTLNAVADALRGRGATLGETIDLLERLLTRFGPHLQDSMALLRKASATADVYAGSADELVRILDNSRRVTAELLVPKERTFAQFLRQSIETSDATSEVVEDNADVLVRLAAGQRSVMELLAYYSGQIPCTIDGLVQSQKAANLVIGGQGPYFRLTLDAFVSRPPYSYPQDLPSNPNSDAHVSNLPPGIQSWEPYCPIVPERVRELPGKASATTGPLPRPPATGSAQDIAPNRDDRGTATHTGSLGGLLLGPLRQEAR